LVTGGGRPRGLDRGWFIEPTVFANVDNSSTIAQEEIFGPVLSVIPADNEDHAVEIANDTIYGLNAAVFTTDNDRARTVAGRLRSGTVGHNAMRADFGLAFGGFKQSGIGREGGREGLHPYLETKTVILDGPPAGYRCHASRSIRRCQSIEPMTAPTGCTSSGAAARRSTPDAGAGISDSTLSVATRRIGSPWEMRFPSSTNHSTTVTSVTVTPSRGTTMSAMSVSHHLEITSLN
jgi:hypothetical protein